MKYISLLIFVLSIEIDSIELLKSNVNNPNIGYDYNPRSLAVVNGEGGTDRLDSNIGGAGGTDVEGAPDSGRDSNVEGAPDSGRDSNNVGGSGGGGRDSNVGGSGGGERFVPPTPAPRNQPATRNHSRYNENDGEGGPLRYNQSISQFGFL